jgi:ABC-2 type transport system permease protein
MDFFSKYRSGHGWGANRRGKVLVTLTLLLLMVPFTQMSIKVYHRFSGLGRPELAVVFMVLLTFLLMTFTAVPLLYSLFLERNDFQYLSALPIPISYLGLAKLNICWLYLAGINLLFWLPVSILSGISLAWIDHGLLTGFLVGIFTPFPPLFFSTLVILALTMMGAEGRRKKLISTGFGFALLGLVLGAQLFLTSEGGVRLVALTEDWSRYYPPAAWLGRLLNGSRLHVIPLIGLTVCCCWGLLMSAGRMYRRALEQSETSAIPQHFSLLKQPRSKYRQLLRRNLLIISKQPVFLMNTLLTLAIPGLILLAGFLAGDFASANIAVSQSQLTLVWVGLTSTPALLVNLSVTAISREGKAFWETKVLPVTTWDNLRSRIETTILINLAASLLILFMAFFYFPLKISAVYPGLFFVVMLTVFLAHSDLVLNIYRPFLNWSHPAAAIKNNLNVILSLAYRPFLAVIPVLTVICLPRAGLSVILFCSGLFLFFLTLWVRKFLQTVMVEKFDQISG